MKRMRDQMSLTVTIGVLCIAILSSVASSWQGATRIRQVLVAQGEQITKNLAEQSVLALVYLAPANATNAVQAALAHSDITVVEIHRPDGQVLLAEGKAGPVSVSNDSSFRDEGPLPPLSLESESSERWRFIAPVYFRHEASPFSLDEPKNELLGYVRVTQSKATLVAMGTNVFVVNFAILACSSIILALVIFRLTTRFTQPLQNLSEAMKLAASGALRGTPPTGGLKEIREIEESFNQMMIALESREQDLERVLKEQRQVCGHLEVVREEQTRVIAREIHDSIGGNLTMLKLGLSSLLEDLPPEGDIPQRVQSLFALSDRTIQVSRNITASLRPAMLDTIGFNRTIRWYATEWSKTTGIEVSLQLGPELTLPGDTTTALYRVVQEALTNISKHAKATQTEITTIQHNDSISIVIEDNGIGIPPDAAHKEGSYGLLGMRERVTYLGGSLEISNRRDGGTSIKVTIPTQLARRPSGHD